MTPGLALVTEGEFKALTAAKHWDALAIGVPGVDNIALALPVLREHGITEVILALDADHRSKQGVYRATCRAVAVLRAEGITVRLLLWDPANNGVDDAIHAGADLLELTGEDIDTHLSTIAEGLGLAAPVAVPEGKQTKPDPLAAVAALAEGYAGDDLRAALRQVAEGAKGLDAIDRACLMSELQRHLKRIKTPKPADLAKLALGKVDEESDEDTTLQPTPPCDEEVSGAQVLARVEAYVNRYIGLPEGGGVALALWVAHTYLVSRLTFSPRLAIQSPVKGCGKTTLMTLLAFLVEKPSPSAWPSTAALFREVEAYSPTLLLDEFDTWIHENEEIRGVINSGFFRPFAYVTRCDGDEHKVKRFKTFGAMALSGINKLPPTIQDRSIVVSLRKKTAADAVDRVQMSEAHSVATAIKPALARFADDIGEELEQTASTVETPSELEDRPADLWRPLLAIADLAGGTWPTRARAAAVRLSGAVSEEDDPGIMLLQDVRDAFEVRGVDRIRTESLLEDLHRRSDRPWKEFTRGRPLSAHRMGAFLSGFDVHSQRLVTDGRRYRGYLLSDFEDAFRRYLFFGEGGEQSVQASQPAPEPRNGAVQGRDTLWDTLNSKRPCVPSETTNGTLQSVPNSKASHEVSTHQTLQPSHSDAERDTWTLQTPPCEKNNSEVDASKCPSVPTPPEDINEVLRGLTL